MSAQAVGPAVPPAAIAELIEEHQAVDEKILRQELENGVPFRPHRVYGIEARTDPTVSFEEYVFWAKIEREMEEEEHQKLLAAKSSSGGWKSILSNPFKKSAPSPQPSVDGEPSIEPSSDPSPAVDDSENSKSGHEKQLSLASTPPPYNAGDLDLRGSNAEWRQTARALRTATWGTIFFLITTDILGWSSTPYVFASVGYGLGVGIYIIFGFAAAFAGWGIYKTFLGLDSARYPMMSFGDPFLRVYGPWSRNFINFAQSLQQFLSVAVILLGNALLLEQIAQNTICFVVTIIIIMVVGMLSGAIRTLQGLSWICNLAVWTNIVNFILIMIGAAAFPIDFGPVGGSTIFKPPYLPVKTFAGPPESGYRSQTDDSFANEFNGINSMVYAYSGAVLFVAFMAEMRHPMDFLKGCFLAQTFICLVYIFFGVFVYSYYGQYAISNISQVVQPYGLQTAANVLSLLTGWYAVFLYFNVGMKTVYIEVFQEMFHFAPISTKKGKISWFILGPIYWIVAFIVAAAVPNFSGIVNFVGGLFSVNFTYSFPVILHLGYAVQRDAALPGEGFDPVTGVTTRFDNGFKRYVRGYMQKPIFNTFELLYIGLALASSGMGTWAAVEGLISVFGPGGTVATSFGCASPV